MNIQLIIFIIGGALLTITGSGFNYESTRVEIDNLPCITTEINYFTINCLTPQNVNILFF